ncbi:hypothetical protein [Enterovirga aerilata]|uniref:Uncharacterized protein n=1 Tax=Enterovirga aerilata TaxID=2730920 RepID=A0A849HWD3_9HYPH|nr:hypothetical protein [Enterovirga sp. DB1703]NNM71412.1 hypothetical protein [Enterovirga sp. DB1703]
MPNDTVPAAALGLPASNESPARPNRSKQPRTASCDVRRSTDPAEIATDVPPRPNRGSNLEDGMSRHEAFTGEATPISAADLVTLSDESARRVDELFAEWLDQVLELKRAQRILAECIAAMPWWAQPGPSTVHSDGRLSGRNSWIPALQQFELPTGMVHIIIRPGESEFRERYLNHPFLREDERQHAFDKAMARLKEREEAQAVEMRRSGTASARRIESEHHLRLSRWSTMIGKTPPSPSRLAFRAIELIAWMSVGDVAFSKQSDALRDLRIYHEGETLKNLIPVLPPRLREQAERVIRPGAGPMRKWSYWHGDTPLRSGFGRPPAELLTPKQDTD